MNVRKTAGPDGITGRVLKSCADQLAGLFTSIFNESLATSVVHTSFTKSVIIPVPKNNKPSCPNYYRPVALTSIVMKVFERLVKNHICSSVPVGLDPLQFAYCSNRSTDDAISHVLHSSLTHIDSKNGNYVRLLFIDYSSAFNTSFQYFDLKRLTTTSTHKSGNQPDLIYTRDCTADNILVQLLHISDHFFIKFTLHFATLVPPTPLSAEVERVQKYSTQVKVPLHY